MIRAVTVTNDAGDSLEMDLFRPYKSGMNITNIDGIGPGKATINSIEMYGLDGASFNSARLSKRQIVIKMDFMDSPDIETVRQRTYRYFPIKREVKLTFKTDNRLLYIKGRVSGNEPDIFQKSENTTITVDCFDPYFYAVQNEGDGRFSFNTLEGGFEFPFMNPVDQMTLEFGKMNYDTTSTLFYTGEVEVGASFILEATYGNVVNPWIQNETTGQRMAILSGNLPIGKSFGKTQSLVINTRRGEKAMLQVTDAAAARALMAVAPGSSWLVLQPGENVLSYGADSGVENLSVEIQFDTVYSAV